MACVISPLLEACSCDEPRAKPFRALSVKQPFASLIGWGIKPFEIRSYATKYRGPLAICSSQKPFDDESLLPPSSLEYYKAHADIMPLGVVVATVELVNCRPMTEADAEKALVPYKPDLFVWELKNPTETIPVAVKGQLGIFSILANQVRFKIF